MSQEAFCVQVEAVVEIKTQFGLLVGARLLSGEPEEKTDPVVMVSQQAGDLWRVAEVQIFGVGSWDQAEVRKQGLYSLWFTPLGEMRRIQEGEVFTVSQNTPEDSPESPLARAYTSLEGLSVGDAFGERFFVAPELAEGMIQDRVSPMPPWTYTDDTEMACSVVAILRSYGEIHQNALARSFAARYDSKRGYGPNMHRLLARIRKREAWATVAASLFEGQGSQGNGAAMRAAPVGAYFAEDLEGAVLHARRSAEVTHAHPEGIAGAIAVAAAAAWAWRLRRSSPPPRDRDFLDLLLPLVPDSLVRERIRHARNLAPGASVRLAVAALGNGIGLSAVDTVPLALWCAARHLDDYVAALWLTVSALGDRDTTCAIVGGIVALYTGVQGIPTGWLRAREPLPDWVA